MSDLAQQVAILDYCVEEAVASYKLLLQRTPDNWMLLRMYAVFLEMIRNDPWNAARQYAEADRLMKAEEDAKQSAFLTESATAQHAAGKAGDGTTKAVIIMNAKCIMQNINKVSSSLYLSFIS